MTEETTFDLNIHAAFIAGANFCGGDVEAAATAYSVPEPKMCVDIKPSSTGKNMAVCPICGGKMYKTYSQKWKYRFCPHCAVGLNWVGGKR